MTSYIGKKPGITKPKSWSKNECKGICMILEQLGTTNKSLAGRGSRNGGMYIMYLFALKYL